MRLKFILLQFAIFSFFLIQAQSDVVKKIGFSIGPEIGMPVGTFNNGWGIGYGGSVKLSVPLNNLVSFSSSVGYINFSGKLISGTKFPSWGSMPIKAGVKFQIGASAFNIEPQIGYTIGSLSGFSSKEVSGLTWALGSGYRFSSVLDLGIRYESWKNKGATESVNFLGLRLGYSL